LSGILGVSIITKPLTQEIEKPNSPHSNIRKLKGNFMLAFSKSKNNSFVEDIKLPLSPLNTAPLSATSTKSKQPFSASSVPNLAQEQIVPTGSMISTAQKAQALSNKLVVSKSTRFANASETGSNCSMEPHTSNPLLINNGTGSNSALKLNDNIIGSSNNSEQSTMSPLLSKSGSRSNRNSALKMKNGMEIGSNNNTEPNISSPLLNNSGSRSNRNSALYLKNSIEEIVNTIENNLIRTIESSSSLHDLKMESTDSERNRRQTLTKLFDSKKSLNDDALNRPSIITDVKSNVQKLILSKSGSFVNGAEMVSDNNSTIEFQTPSPLLINNDTKSNGNSASKLKTGGKDMEISVEDSLLKTKTSSSSLHVRDIKRPHLAHVSQDSFSLPRSDTKRSVKSISQKAPILCNKIIAPTSDRFGNGVEMISDNNPTIDLQTPNPLLSNIDTKSNGSSASKLNTGGKDMEISVEDSSLKTKTSSSSLHVARSNLTSSPRESFTDDVLNKSDSRTRTSKDQTTACPANVKAEPLSHTKLEPFFQSVIDLDLLSSKGEDAFDFSG